MTTGQDGFDPGGRPGVRANALPAGSFARLRIVDARVSDAVLDVLEDAGIAAYVEPSAGEVGAYRDVRPYRAPSDQLYVDAARRDVALAVLEAELPGMLADLEPGTPDDDVAFDAIVAGFDTTPDAPSWPESENAGGGASAARDHDEEWYAARALPQPAHDDEERFVPPPPPPLPRVTGGKLWGLVLLLGGFVLMAVLPRLGFDAEQSIVVGIIATAAGAATLVWCMRETHEGDEDDGAVL